MSDPSSFDYQGQSWSGKERKPMVHCHSYKGPYDKDESKHVCNNYRGKISAFPKEEKDQFEKIPSTSTGFPSDALSYISVVKKEREDDINSGGFQDKYMLIADLNPSISNYHGKISTFSQDEKDQFEKMPSSSTGYSSDTISCISVVKKEREDDINSGGFQDKYMLITDHSPSVEFSSSEINNNKVTTEDLELDRNANESSDMIVEDLTKISGCIENVEDKPDVTGSPSPCNGNKDAATKHKPEGIIDTSHLKQMYQCEFCQIVTDDEPEMMLHLEQNIHSSASLVYATPVKTVVYLKQTSFLKFEKALYQKMAARCPYRYCRGILKDVGSCEAHIYQYNTPIKCTQYYLVDVHSHNFVQIDMKNNKCDKCGFECKVPHFLFRHYRKTKHQPFVIVKDCVMYTACNYCYSSFWHYARAVSHVRKVHSQENVDGKLKLLIFFLKRERKLIELPPYSPQEANEPVSPYNVHEELSIEFNDKLEEFIDIGLLKELYQCEFCQTGTDSKEKMISHLKEELHSSASLVLVTSEESVVYLKQTAFLKVEMAALQKFAAICSKIDCNRILRDVAACEHHIDLHWSLEKSYGYWIAEVFFRELIQIDIKKDICEQCKCHGGSARNLFKHYRNKDHWPFRFAQDCDMFFACTYCMTTYLLYHEAVHHMRKTHECEAVNRKLNLLVLFLNQERKMVKLPPYAPGKEDEVNYINTKIRILTEKECKDRHERRHKNVVIEALKWHRKRLQKHKI